MIVCSGEDKEKSHIISKLHLYRRPVVPKLVDSECREYLKSHFIHHPDMVCSEQVVAGDVKASVVDPDKLASHASIHISCIMVACLHMYFMHYCGMYTYVLL